jgi:pimeloyl-ACP methyl ester carboxylesterase
VNHEAHRKGKSVRGSCETDPEVRLGFGSVGIVMVGRLPPVLYWIAVCVLILTGCGDEPEALEVSCADTLQSRQPDVTCYTVSVPADHSEPDGDTMELFVVVLDNPGGDEIGPVAYLVGGPGGAAHTEVNWMRRLPFDVVLVDQRGTGLSEPFLGCPEWDAVVPLLPSTGYAEGSALLTGALVDCGSRLASGGVDVTLFDTESNARDFEIVREALGYDEWNLWGGSYGSRLGLEILRLNPETARAAVFDSVSAPQADLVAEWPDHLRHAVDLMTASCASAPDCRDAYGDIGAVLTTLVEQLDAQPVDLDVGERRVRMDGAALVDAVRNALFDTEVIPRLPFMLKKAADGDLVPLAEIRSSVGTPSPTFSPGMHWSVHCRDYFSATDQDALNAALADEPEGFDQWFSYTWFTETCAQWGAGTSPSSTREPVITDVPTLLMAGQFDPGTPPKWAQLVAEGLANSTYIEFARFGHGLGLCGETAAVNFLLDPTQSPDIPCDPTRPPQWRLP